MNRWISVVDRIIVLIVGIALLAAGAYAIAWDAGVAAAQSATQTHWHWQGFAGFNARDGQRNVFH